ncbi:MAG: TetR/AcrR family transcriptional regulator [Acidimicrobiales bacterium]|nr:TetR/AcrR family transcriptional regulator [Acidimicrobiales bacterium]
MTTATRDTGLTPEHVVDVARRLISEHGLEWFSMRKLAAELDVNPMTVYLRFENKDDLLDAVARHALSDVRLPDLPDGPWEERAAALCIALRSHLLADRNLLELFATADRLSGAVAQAVEHGLTLMEELGLADDDAVQGFRTLFWHTVGFTLVDHRFDSFPADSPGGLQASIGAIDAETHPTFARHLPSFTSVDGDALFAHTTRLLVAGMHAAATSLQGAP